MNREQRINIYGSPHFPYKPAIVANGIWTFAPNDGDTEQKYLPMDSFAIFNDSTSDIDIIIRDNILHIIAGTTREEKNIYFNEMTIKEKSGLAINAGDLSIEIFRSPMDADKKAIRDAENNNTLENIKKMFSMSGGI